MATKPWARAASEGMYGSLRTLRAWWPSARARLPVAYEFSLRGGSWGEENVFGSNIVNPFARRMENGFEVNLMKNGFERRQINKHTRHEEKLKRDGAP